jgi:hypothetical protein
VARSKPFSLRETVRAPLRRSLYLQALRARPFLVPVTKGPGRRRRNGDDEEPMLREADATTTNMQCDQYGQNHDDPPAITDPKRGQRTVKCLRAYLQPEGNREVFWEDARTLGRTRPFWCLRL